MRGSAQRKLRTWLCECVLMLLLVEPALLSSCRTYPSSRRNWVSGPKAWSAQVGQVNYEEWAKREAEYVDAMQSRN